MSLFDLGQVVATPAVIEFLERERFPVLQLLSRHAAGDWGEELAREDQRANDEAVRAGLRIFSKYKVSDQFLWVITEADRSSTCVLFPHEY